MNSGAQTVGNGPGNIFKEPSAGDVADALHPDSIQERQHRLDIDLGGNQQRLTGRLAAQLRPGRLPLQTVFHIKDLPHQREPVGVHTGGGQRNDHISRDHGAVIDDLLFIHDAHRETRQIVFVLRVEAGHFRRFSADQRTARLDAALRHAGHQLCNSFRHIFAAGNVVQEKQGLRSTADHIVDTHSHAVDAYRVMPVHQEGQAQLRPHTVGAGNQHRLLVALQIQSKQPAEAADVIQAALVFGAGNVRLHQLHRPVSGGNVHTGRLIALGIAFLVHISGSFSESFRSKRYFLVCAGTWVG